MRDIYVFINSMTERKIFDSMFERLGIKTVLWDIDGTLIDSEPAHHDALLGCAAFYGVDLDFMSRDQFVGIQAKDVWTELKDLFPTETTYQRWISVIEDYYVDLLDRISPMPGAKETVEALAKMVKQGAVSNSGRSIVDANLKRLGFRDSLEVTISLSDVTEGKPDPQPYQLALEVLNMDPKEAIAVEDSLTGIQSAKNAGLWTVAYCNPTLPADAFINNLLDIPQLLGVYDVQN